jgi:hypothetical protein
MKRLELLRWLVLALLLVGAGVTSLVALLNGESLWVIRANRKRTRNASATDGASEQSV